MAANPRPCLVCKDPNIIGTATWIPDDKRRIAAGGSAKDTPVFVFCLCEKHSATNEANSDLIKQIILRNVQEGNSKKVDYDNGNS